MLTLKLEPQVTAQTRMVGALSNFILQNLAAKRILAWQDAWNTHLDNCARYGLRTDSDAWLEGRVDPDADRPFGLRLSRRIQCESCGRCFGHKTWHSGTPNCADVWECPTNYAKRGTYKTPHIYQTVLLGVLAKTFQALINRDRQVRTAVATLVAARAARPVEKVEAAIRGVAMDAHPVLHLPGFLSVFDGACVLTDNRLGYVFTTGDAVTLELPRGWTPKKPRTRLQCVADGLG